MRGATILFALAALLLVGSVGAQSGAGYDLSWWTVAAGGGTVSTGGGYALGGTIGQPEAGLLSGGDYALGGAFWGGGAVTVSHDVFLPVVLRGG